MGEVRRGRERIQKIFRSKRGALDWEKDQKDIPPENWKIPLKSSLGEMVNEYLQYSKTKHSLKTFREKKALFKRFFAVADPEIDADRLQPKNVLSYLQSQAQNRSGYAANRDRKNLVAAWNWGIMGNSR